MEAHVKLVTFLIVAIFASFVYEFIVAQIGGFQPILSWLNLNSVLTLALTFVLPVALLAGFAAWIGLWVKKVRYWGIPATLLIAVTAIIFAAAVNTPCYDGCY
jgi:hypothetical protein